MIGLCFVCGINIVSGLQLKPVHINLIISQLNTNSFEVFYASVAPQLNIVDILSVFCSVS
jgi:hypothetical protein